jgi:hypothetical protein
MLGEKLSKKNFPKIRPVFAVSFSSGRGKSWSLCHCCSQRDTPRFSSARNPHGAVCSYKVWRLTFNLMVLLSHLLNSTCTNISEVKRDISNYVRFEVLTAASMKMTVFWVVATCILIEVYRQSSINRAMMEDSSPWCWRQQAALKRR